MNHPSTREILSLIEIASSFDIRQLIDIVDDYRNNSEYIRAKALIVLTDITEFNSKEEAIEASRWGRSNQSSASSKFLRETAKKYTFHAEEAADWMDDPEPAELFNSPYYPCFGG